MPLVRLLPERWQKLMREALTFGVVGGVNTVINYAVFNALALTVFADGQLKAAVAATLVATVTSYLMNRHWTYRDRPRSAMRREYTLFFLFNATGLLIELGVLAAAKYGLGVTSLLALNVAKTAGVVLATLFRFWSYRTFVFQPVPVQAYQEERKPVAEPATEKKQAQVPPRPPLVRLRAVRPRPASGPVQSSRPATAADDRPARPTAVPLDRVDPLDPRLISIDSELEAELAAELHATTRRAPRR